jgi:DNA polymerase-1
MVRHESRFLVDTAFIIERTYQTFFGTPLLTAQGSDHTFTFAFARDFLRLRSKLGIRAGVLVIGRESHSLTTDQNIENIIIFLQELKIPYIRDPSNTGLKMVGSLGSQFSHIVTGDKRFLQLTGYDVTVVLVRHASRYQCDWVSSDTVRTIMGIAPENVLTYLALTESSNAQALTSTQAVRLIELYGDLDSIYENLSKVASGQIRKKLVKNETRARDYYSESKPDRASESVSCNLQTVSLGDLDTDRNRQLLRTYGFHSLLPLLANHTDVRLDLNEITTRLGSYHAVVDGKGIQELESLMLSSKQCSIDTESDDKDPREAVLLGVAFSVKGGEAYFVPLIEEDLKGLCKDDVLKFLKRICNSGISFIGHNIKYDYLLLRRNGIRIKSIQFDTMLAAYDCHGDWDFFNLRYLAQRFLGEKIKSYSDLVDEDKTFLDLPLKDLVNHACQDADVTMRLYPIFLAELNDRNITEQYYDQTMRLMMHLAELEFQGIAADWGQIDAIRRSLSKKASDLKDDICKKVGIVFDLDSDKDLSAVLKEALVLRGYLAPRKITMAILEQVAICEPIVRLVVQYKKLRSRVLGLESVSACVTGGRIYPLFNQIKSRAGLLSTVKPNLFENDTLPELKSCFDSSVRDYFRDKQRSLDILSQVTQDPVLRDVRASKSKVDVFMAEHAVMKDLDHDECLLSLAVGQSDSKLSREFLVDRVKIREIRNDLGERYSTMFRWLDSYRRKAQANGYAAIDGKRKYIDGLKSSDMARRDRAMEEAVRWLIRY